MKNQSKIIEFPINNSFKTSVVLTKKRMKNIRLTVSKSGTVAVSLPYYASYSYAYEFLVRKREWLNYQLNKIALSTANDCCNFKNNGNIFLLGNSYNLKLELSNKNKLTFSNDFIIYTKSLNSEYVKQIFLKWCKKYFLDFFTNRLHYIYRKIFNNENYPEIKIKTMKSMWGNCNFASRIITLNLYLAKANIECIDYVITHELSHLIHHNHGAEFHKLMTMLIPNWKQLKKTLNSYCLNF